MTKKNKAKIRPLKCVWGIMCSNSSVDIDSNLLSLFNILEEFSFPDSYFKKQAESGGTLVFPLSYELVTYWRRTLDVSISGEEILAEVHIKTINPQGIVVQETLTQFKFFSGMKNMRLRIKSPGIVADCPGDYINSIGIKLPGEKDFYEELDIPFTVRSFNK